MPPAWDRFQSSKVSANYIIPTVMLYMGGFLLATGIEKMVVLHRRLHLNNNKFIRNRIFDVSFGIYPCDRKLSMWISKFCTSLDDATDWN